MARMSRVVLFVGCFAAGLLAFIAIVLACSSPPFERVAVPALSPAADKAFFAGELGVVRPTFTRQYLVMAYRRLAGRAPQGEDLMPPPLERAPEAPVSPWTQWLTARYTVRKDPPPMDKQYGFVTFRQYRQYMHFDNCTGDALLTATRTLQARIERFGASSAVVQDWLTAQDTVFANCPSAPLQLPAAAPPNADPLVRADRTYQTAAAYFYGMQYQDAEAAFRTIAEDRSSVWRPWGRYLAARALIRRATLVASDTEAGDLLERADRELDGVMKDASLADMHERARRLRGYVAIRRFPAERVHELSARMSSAGQMQEQDLIDYRWLFDTRVSSNVSYDYGTVKNLDALRRDDDMTDWILVMQGWGDASRLRALERWRATQAPHWLVAVMWKLRANDTDVPAVMAAAAAVPRDSPAFATLAFLRARLLLERNEKDAARALLAQLPDAPGPGLPADTVNLLRAERFLLARDLDELLRYAPRVDVGGGEDWESVDERTGTEGLPPLLLDVDAVTTLNERLPLARLANAAASPYMTKEFGPEIALAAWTRAVLAGNDAVALRLAATLPQSAPDLVADLKQYRGAPAGAKRHFAAIYVLLRHPGMSPYLDPDERPSLGRTTRDDFDHQSYNWWCAPGHDRWGGEATGRHAPRAGDAPEILFPHFEALAPPASFPEFLSAGERQGLAAERAALVEVGSAANYLAGEAVNWARAEPKNPLVAEALALAVEGTRWGACYSDDTGARSKLAFQTLHKLFPNSEWAKRTKYWYNGRW